MTLTADVRTRRHVVEVDGVAYATDLLWAQAETMAEARAAARRAARDIDRSSAQKNATLACYRDGMRVQYGIGDSSAGQLAGMPSLAASLVEASTGGPWIGFWEIEGRFYVAAGDQDVVDPQTDRLIAERTSAEELFSELYSADPDRWIEVYAPVELGVPDARSLDLEDVLQGVRAGILKPLGLLSGLSAGGLNSRRMKLAAAVALLAIVVGGGLGYVHWKEAQRRAEIQAMIEKAREAKRRGEEVGVSRDVPRPWLAQPMPGDFIEGCLQALTPLMRPGPGWALSGADCKAGRAAVTWRREHASIYQFRLWAASAFPGTSPAIGQSGEQVSLSNSFEAAARGEDGVKADDLLPAGRIVDRLTEAFQVVGIDAVMTPPRPYTEIDIKQAEESRQPLPPQAQRVAFSTPLLPSHWAGFAESLPASAVRAISWTPGGGWSIEVEIYQRPG